MRRAILCLALLAGCSDDNVVVDAAVTDAPIGFFDASPPRDAATVDAVVRDALLGDAAVRDAAVRDAAVRDAAVIVDAPKPIDAAVAPADARTFDATPVAFGTLTAAPNDVLKFGVLPPQGYYEYLPTEYSPVSGKQWPLIIFLTGSGETGNGNTQLVNVLNAGLPLVIKNETFPAHDQFVVLMPQHTGFFDANRIDAFLTFARAHYRLDEHRMYLTGLSLGAIATLGYGAARGDDNPFAAMLPLSGNDAGEGCKYKLTPMWFFHGKDDANQYTLASMSVDSVARINACSPTVPAKVTLYTGCGHAPCAWTPTYDVNGMSKPVDAAYAPYDQSIYDWLLQYTR